MNRTPLIYIASPYSGKNYFEIERNINKAAEIGSKLLRRGWNVFIPHLNFNHGELWGLNFEHEDWLKLDLDILKRCDAIYLCEGWNESKGCQKEFHYAYKNNITIYHGDLPDAKDFEYVN